MFVPKEVMVMNMAINTLMRDGADPSAMTAARALLDHDGEVTARERMIAVRIMVHDGDFPVAQAEAATRLVMREMHAAATP